METFYSILNVSEKATAKEIKKAYHRMAFKYHPDKVNGLGDKIKRIAETEFKRINEAKEVLLDPFRRAEYDRLLAYEFQGRVYNTRLYPNHPGQQRMEQSGKPNGESLFLQTMIVNLRHELTQVEKKLEEEMNYRRFLEKCLNERGKKDQFSPKGRGHEEPKKNEDIRHINPWDIDNKKEDDYTELVELKPTYDAQWDSDEDDSKEEFFINNAVRDYYRNKPPHERRKNINFKTIDDEMKSLEELGYSHYVRTRVNNNPAKKFSTPSRIHDPGSDITMTKPRGSVLKACPLCGREVGNRQTYCYFCGTIF